MNNFGKKLRITLFGASHEPFIGIVIDGYPAGITLDMSLIRSKLMLRKGLVALTSSRLENDDFQISSGYFQNFTTGAPITFLVKNEDVKSADYEKQYGIARPSHGDFVLHEKYHGFNDYRGGGTASGRLTVVLVILGALCEQLLKQKNIWVGSIIKSLGNIVDDRGDITKEDIQTLADNPFPVRDNQDKDKMLEAIKQVSLNQDSLGAIVQTGVFNLPIGLGQPFFDSVESIISHLMFSIPGVKGIEFGSGFQMALKTGSMVNDPMFYQNNQINYGTNNAGGINSGITNGNPLIFQTAFRPTPSIGLCQDTVDYLKKINVKNEIKGRHDVVFAIKGLHVVNALTNYAILEMLFEENLWTS